MNAVDETISDQSHEVFRILESCASSFTGRNRRLAETQRDRFRLWSDNVGVFAPSRHSSLDNRLRQAPELTKALFGILRNLYAQAIRGIAAINCPWSMKAEADHTCTKARDAITPKADANIGPETAVLDSAQSLPTDDSKLDDIREHNLRRSDETIEWLFRFSRIIRQGGIRDPLSKGGLRDPLSRVAEFKIVEDFEVFEADRRIPHQTALTEHSRKNDDRLQDWLSMVVPDAYPPVTDFIIYNEVKNSVIQEDIGTTFNEFVREVMRVRLPKKDDGVVIDEWLHDRLSEAIYLRRKHFLYVREHQRKLKAPPRPAQEHPHVKRSSQAPSTTALKSKLLSECRPRIAEVTSSVHLGTMVSFLPSDDVVPQPAPSLAFSTASSRSIAPTQCEIPPAPQLQVGAREHQCPYCCLVWPAEEFTNEGRWKYHVIRDLRPYVCLYRNCPFPEELFASFRDWRRHMQMPHGTEWICPVYTRRKKKAQKDTSEASDKNPCGVLELNKQPWLHQSRDALENHMKACHSDLFSASQVTALAGRSKRASRPPSECPFGCTEFSDAFYRHVAAHLQDLALISLPWRDDIDSEVNSDVDSEVNSDIDSEVNSGIISLYAPYFSGHQKDPARREKEIEILKCLNTSPYPRPQRSKPRSVARDM